MDRLGSTFFSGSLSKATKWQADNLWISQSILCLKKGMSQPFSFWLNQFFECLVTREILKNDTEKYFGYYQKFADLSLKFYKLKIPA